jgi:hypothetical protein
MNESGLSPVIIVAIISGIVSILALTLNAIINSRKEQNTRQRQEFSKAFSACVAYEEFVYIVRRRRSDTPQEERTRISSELSNIQRELGYYSAWLAIESADVCKAYERLLTKLREVAGTQIREGWLSSPVLSDNDMNISDLGMEALKPYKEEYLRKVSEYLSYIPKPLRNIAARFRIRSKHHQKIISSIKI